MFIKVSKKTVALFMAALLLVVASVAVLGGYIGAAYFGNAPAGEESAAEITTAGTVLRYSEETGEFQTDLSQYYDSDAIKAAGVNELTIPEIVAKSANSVVEIRTEKVTTSQGPGQYVSQGAGSGVIFTADGYIVTNNHVISGASTITVRLRDGTEYSARLIGRDSQSDLAVVKIEAEGLSAVSLGTSEDLVVGELAVAIGNPLGQLGGTVSEGIISALGRDIYVDGEKMTLLQTTASINPGNSGGGLFDGSGNLVGIVNAKSSGTGIEGIGFAIPIDTALPVIEQLLQNGYVSGRVTSGLSFVEVGSTLEAYMYGVNSLGLYVSRSYGEFAAGDRIVSVAGETVSTESAFNAVIEKYSVGDRLDVVVVRGGADVTLSLTLEQKVE